MHNDATQEPLLNLAPKRPNWDLKRDLEPQMNKLRKMTDRASESKAIDLPFATLLVVPLALALSRERLSPKP